MRVTVAIEAPRDRVFDLVRDQSQRGRFMPDGWRLIRCLTPDTDRLGSQMEIEASIGPTTRRVIETLALDADRLIEGPPAADNFVTTWTFLGQGSETIVDLEMEFEYGGFLGELLIKRSLRRALTQQLLRLGGLASAETRG